MRHMECVALLDRIDKALKCVCLQRGTSHSPKKRDDVGRREGKKLPAAGERFGMIPFPSNVSTMQAARASIAIHSFTTELLWSSHHFYMNRFFRGSAVRKNRAYE